MDSYEWLGRCAHRLMELEPNLPDDDAWEDAILRLEEHGERDPIEVANGNNPANATKIGVPVGFITEAQWIDRYVARVGQITQPGQITPEAAVARGLQRWFGAYRWKPEVFADMEFGVWKMPPDLFDPPGT